MESCWAPARVVVGTGLESAIGAENHRRLKTIEGTSPADGWQSPCRWDSPAEDLSLSFPSTMSYPHSRRSFGNSGLIILMTLYGIVLGGPSLVRYLIYAQTLDTVRFTVNKVERVVDRGGQSARYMVFTDKESFENTDVWLLGKYDSADLHGRIRPGSTYQARVSGWRVPMLSWFRNIISLQDAKSK